MEKCDGFWQWGSARKNFTLAEISSAASGSSCSMPNTISSAAGGSSSEIPKEQVQLETRQCMDASLIRRSQRISESNASKCRAPSRNLGLSVQSSILDVNLSKKGDFIVANSRKSPISVIQDHVSSSDISHSSTISCYPHGDLSPELDCSGEILVEDQVFCDQKKPSKLRVRRRDQKTCSEHSWCCSHERIHNRYTSCNSEISMGGSSSCSISKAAAKDMPLQSQGMNEEMENLRPLCGSGSNSTNRDLSFKKPRRGQNLISKSSFESQKKKSELLFAALHMLADMAALENGSPGCKEGEKDSTRRWVSKTIFHPTGVPFSQKKVIRRAKSVRKYVCPYSNVEKLMAADSKPLLSDNAISKLGNPGCMKPSDNQVVEGGATDKDEVAVQSVRSSKRTRSQFLNSKYCDSVLQPLKKGTRR